MASMSRILLSESVFWRGADAHLSCRRGTTAAFQPCGQLEFRISPKAPGGVEVRLQPSERLCTRWGETAPAGRPVISGSAVNRTS